MSFGRTSKAETFEILIDIIEDLGFLPRDWEQPI